MMEIENTFNALILPPFKGKETENNWHEREKAVFVFRKLVVEESAFNSEIFHSIFKQHFLDHLCQATQSLRSALVSASCGAICDLAINAGTAINPYVEKILTALLKLTCQSKKIIASLGESTACTLLSNVSFNPRVFSLLTEFCYNEKNPSGREKGVELLRIITETGTKSNDNRNSMLRSGSLELLDKALSKILNDSIGAVREKGRVIYSLYEEHWPEKAHILYDTFEHNVKKAFSRSKSLKPSLTPSLISSISKIKVQNRNSIDDIPVTIFTVPKTQNLSSNSPTNRVARKSSTAASPTSTAKNQLNGSKNLSPAPVAKRTSFSNIQTRSSSVNVKNEAPPSPKKPRSVSETLEDCRKPSSGPSSVDVSRISIGMGTDASILNDEMPSFKELDSFDRQLDDLSDTVLTAYDSTPKALQKFSTGGLVGSSLKKDQISLTPLLNCRKEFNPWSSKNTPATPGVDFKTKSARLLSQLNDVDVSEKTFRRICRYAKYYAQHDASIDRSSWAKNFPDFIPALVSIAEKEDTSALTRENAVITLKHALSFHPELFQNYENIVLDCLFKIWDRMNHALMNQKTNTALELSIAAEEALTMACRKLDRVLICQLAVEMLRSSKSESYAGRCFQLLTMIVQRFDSNEDDNGIHPLEQFLIIPVFQNDLVSSYIMCSYVLTRMAVYEFLVEGWKILGDDYVKQYLVPVNIQGGFLSGLKLPCYKLFLTLVEQEKLRMPS